MKLLDLSTFAENYFDIKMENGDLLSLRKPTEKVLLAVMNYEEVLKSNDTRKIMEVSRELALTILNTNKEHKIVESAVVEEMPMVMITTIIRHYITFINEVRSDPNS